MDRSTGLICDQTIALNNYYASQDYPAYLRGIRYRDPENQQEPGVLDQHSLLPVPTICALYKGRWQVELFFKLTTSSTCESSASTALPRTPQNTDLDHRLNTCSWRSSRSD